MPSLNIKSISIIVSFIILMPVLSFSGEVDLPETGQTNCYDEEGNVIYCRGTGQDGDILAGVKWPTSRFTINGDGTITDNLTGLVWLRNLNATGGSKDWMQAINYCNNLASGSAGLTDGSIAGDWRLPNIVELDSLINADEIIPTTWLGHQGFTFLQRNRYWSATTDAEHTYNAWYIFEDHIYNVYKSSTGYVLPIRDGQVGVSKPWQTGQKASYKAGDDGDLERGVAWPSPRFSDNGDGSVTDKLTGLVWLKDANAGGDKMNWAQALEFCKNLSSGAYGIMDGSVAGEWRLPNRKELLSLVDYSQYNPSLHQDNPFQNVQSSSYWSSTTYVYSTNTDFAWGVGMGNGHVENFHKTYYNYVWPVRAGKYGSFDDLTLLGDINNDRIIDILDVILAIQVMIKQLSNDYVFFEADVNNDKKIGLAEVQYILQIIAGLREPPYVPEDTLTNSLGMIFNLIPAGNFIMGSPTGEDGRNDAETQHWVWLTKGYYIQTMEVTVGQWRGFIQETDYKTNAETGGGAWVLKDDQWLQIPEYYWDNPGFEQTEAMPVTCVSWNDVQVFIQWLNKKEGVDKYMLPTEAEWEYAARAGQTTMYSFGYSVSALEKYAWYGSNSGGTTHPVGVKRPNGWGLYDMHGNLAELVADWYGEYPSGGVEDPQGPSSGSYRVYRGGSWLSGAWGVRSAYRGGATPDSSSNFVGFRLSRSE